MLSQKLDLTYPLDRSKLRLQSTVKPSDWSFAGFNDWRRYIRRELMKLLGHNPYIVYKTKR